MQGPGCPKLAPQDFERLKLMLEILESHNPYFGRDVAELRAKLVGTELDTWREREREREELTAGGELFHCDECGGDFESDHWNDDAPEPASKKIK
jgi:hypothetical protein